MKRAFFRTFVSAVVLAGLLVANLPATSPADSTTVIMPDVHRMKSAKAVKLLTGLGLRVTWIRSYTYTCDPKLAGTVSHQFPKPGTRLSPGAKVILRQYALDSDCRKPK